jgi:phospholipid/cholesterol/gamma-HCH transport system ATP-binding protein
VVFAQVFKAFGTNQVLRNVLFSVPAGKALCILGRSGTGKSVTLKLLMAPIKPDQGRIWVDGDDITRLKPAGVSMTRRKMGFLFQDAALFDSLTLYHNLALPLRRLSQKTATEIDFAVDDVLRQVGLRGTRTSSRPACRAECEREPASRGHSCLNPRFFSRTNRAAVWIASPRPR